MKKIVSFILTLAMVMSLGSVPVFAADTNTITSMDEGSNAVSKAVTVTYIPEDEKAVITGVSVTVDGQTYNSGETVTLTPNSGNVTITVKGNNFTNLNANNNKLLYADSSFDDVSSADGWTVNDENTEASKTFEASTFQNCTTAFEIKYSNEGAGSDKYIGSGIHIVYQNETVSIGITWGAMNFTYSDEQVDGSDKGWTCETGANTVKVENNGDESIAAGISYTAESNYSNIKGTFDKNFATIAKDGNATFTLTLSGKPDAALSGTNIGSVTVAITEAINVASESDLKAALTSGGKIKLVDSFEISNFIVSTSTPVVLDLNGKTLTSTNEDNLIIEFGSNVTINDSIGNGGMELVQSGPGVANNVLCFGTVVINGGNYQKAMGYNIWFEDNGDVTINGGTFAMVAGASGTITIKGGTINYISFNSGVVACITGGTFGVDPSKYVDTNNYTVTKNGDTWTVEKK